MRLLPPSQPYVPPLQTHERAASPCTHHYPLSYIRILCVKHGSKYCISRLIPGRTSVHHNNAQMDERTFWPPHPSQCHEYNVSIRTQLPAKNHTHTYSLSVHLRPGSLSFDPCLLLLVVYVVVTAHCTEGCRLPCTVHFWFKPPQSAVINLLSQKNASLM